MLEVKLDFPLDQEDEGDRIVPLIEDCLIVGEFFFGEVEEDADHIGCFKDGEHLIVEYFVSTAEEFNPEFLRQLIFHLCLDRQIAILLFLVEELEIVMDVSFEGWRYLHIFHVGIQQYHLVLKLILVFPRP